MILQHLPKDNSGRYAGIDIFRGAAIFTMLMANSAAESLISPFTAENGVGPEHPFWLRIYGSFAAPIFIFLAGFMVGIGYQKHPLSYFVKRGLEIILVGALIDFFIWRIIPGTTFDVLYLTGLGIPVAAFTLKLKTPLRIALCILFFALGPILQHLFYYEPMVHEFALDDFPFPHHLSMSMQHFNFVHTSHWWIKSWLFDGWFPVFPWMGFIMAGTLVFTHGSRIVNNAKLYFPLGLVLFGQGLIWLYNHHPIDEREGYSELFYPPGIAYLCAALGAIIMGVSLLKYLKPVFPLNLLRYLGSCSLFIYIFHSAVIYFVLDNYFVGMSLKNYLIMYVIFAAFMIACAWGLFELKKTEGWKKMPKFLRFIFGG